MQRALEETLRRRRIQEDYNQKYEIVPQSIQKSISQLFDTVYQAEAQEMDLGAVAEPLHEYVSGEQLETTIQKLEQEMKTAAQDLEFERAAQLRDRIKLLRQRLLYEL
jgi:excinuclease ABC subunit B